MSQKAIAQRFLLSHGKINGRAFQQVEKSRFVRENGLWFYVDGDVADEHA